MGNAILVLLSSLLAGFGGIRNQAPMGDPLVETPPREITFYFQNRHESLAIALFGDPTIDGVAPRALKQLSHFVRCYRTDRERAIHPRLAEIVARVAEAFGRDAVDVISGFRAPPFGAPHSKHFLGRAMDFHLRGVASTKVAAWVWRNFRGVGVGVYPKQDFLHVDVRDVDVRWVDQALHGESAHARYFGRARGKDGSEEALPLNAPRLAYDAPRPVPGPALVAGLSAGVYGRGVSDGY